MLRKCVREPDGFHQLHLVKNLLWLLHFLITHHIPELFRFVRRILLFLVLTQIVHMLLLEDEHPISVERKRFFGIILLLSVFE